jgi:hypothetical protein
MVFPSPPPSDLAGPMMAFIYVLFLVPVHLLFLLHWQMLHWQRPCQLQLHHLHWERVPFVVEWEIVTHFAVVVMP